MNYKNVNDDGTCKTCGANEWVAETRGYAAFGLDSEGGFVDYTVLDSDFVDGFTCENCKTCGAPT